MASRRRWAALRYARLIAEVKRDEEISSSIESSVANNVVSGVTQLDIDNAIANLVSSAPDALNTLDELSAALGDDANFATTITTSLNNKANTAMLSNYLQVSNTSSFSTSFANLTDVDISGATDGQTLTYNANGTITATTIDVGSSGGGSTSRTYSYIGPMQENVSTQRLYVGQNSTLSNIYVVLGTAGNTSTEIQVKKNGTVINTITIPADTTTVSVNSTESLSVGDYFTVDITKSSSATNLYVTLIYGASQ